MHRSIYQKHGYSAPVWGSLTVVIPVHTRTVGNNIVVVVLTLTRRQIEFVVTAGQAPITPGVEEYLRKLSDKTNAYTRKLNRSKKSVCIRTRYIYNV